MRRERAQVILDSGRILHKLLGAWLGLLMIESKRVELARVAISLKVVITGWRPLWSYARQRKCSVVFLPNTSWASCIWHLTRPDLGSASETVARERIFMTIRRGRRRKWIGCILRGDSLLRWSVMERRINGMRWRLWLMLMYWAFEPARRQRVGGRSISSYLRDF